MNAAASNHRTPDFDGRWPMEVLTLAALYFLTARLGLLMAIPGGHVTPVWPPSGIALAALLLRGRRVWPGIWLGSFAANLWDFYGSPVSLAAEVTTSATFGIGASLAALLGRQLLRRVVGERNPLERVRDVCAFMALGGVASCLIPATIGVTTLCLAGFAPWQGYGQAWLTWWLGDTAGVIVVAPLLLVWDGPLRRTSRTRWVELLCGFGLLIAVTYYVFIENAAVAFAGEPLPFALVPFLIWSAVRFGRRGAAVAVGLIAPLAVWGTIHGSGPFNLGSRHESLLALELFLSVVSLTALCLAAVVMAQRHAEDNRRRVLDELESRVMERTASLDQANTALRESEACTRLLIKSSNIGLWDWNLVTDDVLYSLEWKSQLGYADDEVPGRYQEWESRLHPEDREPALRAVREFREGQRQDYDIELRLRHKDGSWRSILSRADLIRDGTGQPVRMVGCHIDITARKRAEEALNVQALRYKTLMETSTDAIYVLDQEGDLQEANAAFLRQRGYSAAEVKGLNIADWDARWTREQLQARLRELAGGSAVFETQHRCKDGSVFDVEVCTTSVLIDGEQLFFVVTRDISERKRAEDRLRRSEEKFKALFGIAPVGISVLDRQHNVADANPALERIMRLSREELLGGIYRLRSYLNADGTPRPPSEFPSEHAVAQGLPINDVEVGIIAENGEIIWTQVSVAPLALPEASAVVITQDITQRKHAEQALRESEERFRELAENINEVFWIWTAMPGEPRLLYVSSAYETIWGRSCESLYSSPQSWKKALHPNDTEWVLAEIAKLDVEKVNDLTYRIVRPDQSIRWIRDRIFPVRDGHGAVVRFAGIAQDITESKVAEEAVRKANRQLRNLSRRRIQEQEDERRRLSRELHDQIGQSLTAAKINVDAVRTGKDPALVERLDETAAILDQLLGQVRQISLDLRPPMLDDLGLVPALRSFIDEQGRRASVAVRFSAEHVPEKLDAEIQITCFRIAQEAITNAVRHAKATQLEIALRCTQGKKLRLLARDNGIGFDAQPKQAQAVDLGLIGIRERAALVGGRAKIISSPRNGTTIDVSLPLTFRPERQARHIGT